MYIPYTLNIKTVFVLYCAVYCIVFYTYVHYERKYFFCIVFVLYASLVFYICNACCLWCALSFFPPPIPLFFLCVDVFPRATASVSVLFAAY